MGVKQLKVQTKSSIPGLVHADVTWTATSKKRLSTAPVQGYVVEVWSTGNDGKALEKLKEIHTILVCDALLF